MEEVPTPHEGTSRNPRWRGREDRSEDSTSESSTSTETERSYTANVPAEEVESTASYFQRTRVRDDDDDEDTMVVVEEMTEETEPETNKSKV
jgi:hypothetical protein